MLALPIMLCMQILETLPGSLEQGSKMYDRLYIDKLEVTS